MLTRTCILLITLLGSFLPAAFAKTIPVTVNAVVLSKSQCKFNTANATLDFGQLDASNPINVAAAGAINFRCLGSAPIAVYLITADDGQHAGGPGNRSMQHATNIAAHLPYSITLSPTSGSLPRNTSTTLTIDGQILGSDYAGAVPGIYSDTVILSINP